MRRNFEEKKDNKGFSLVELLVAITIGAVVSGAVIALISFSLKTYNNEKVNSSMQFELQTNLNQIMDEIMASSGMVIKQADADRTYYAAFGDFTWGAKDASNHDLKKVTFDGVVFVSSAPDAQGKFRVYMNRKKVVDAADAKTAVVSMVEDIVTDVASPDFSSADKYLLGENVVKFRLTPDSHNTFLSGVPTKYAYNDSSDSSIKKTEGRYVNPLSVKVELSVSEMGTGKTYTKSVVDEATMRNKAVVDIFIDDKIYMLKSREDE